MKLTSIFQSFLAISSTFAAPSASCTANKRLAGAEAILYAYNLVAPGASAAAFKNVLFAPDCRVLLYADGLPGIEVTFNDVTSYAFALNTRQVFSKVTGEYVDFPKNGTTDIKTNVTLGALHTVLIPVTFSANVYLDYNNDTCLIEAVRAFARIPSQVLGEALEDPKISTISTYPITAPTPGP